ncbi:MAG: imidazole glycerol phosphate synthase subunit HisH [Candidatus Saganbacteria bacterium]|nr:imidazole glycerol phosphate synthase subunit HisH [Candidatus Saganbacteria bacterium]
MIVIIDYGAGNLRSVQKALEQLGYQSLITRDKTEIRTAKAIILPGVGSFDSAIKELRQHGLEGIIQEVIARKIPFLGICLGYQLLFQTSEEGSEKGLGIIEGAAKRFNFTGTSFSNHQIPHMGWNRLLIKHKNPLLKDIPEGSMVYFAHSYYPDPKDKAIIMTETDYGLNFASSIAKDNLFGIQFHPEKSGEVGLKMLKNFGSMLSK